MRTCWIVYGRSDLEANRFFAERLRDGLEGHGFDATIATTDSLPDGTPDAVVNRSRDWMLAYELESRGVRVFNSSTVCRVCNDKLESCRLAGKLGIPYMPTSIPGLPFPPGPPWVVKSRSGHGGTEVFRADGFREVEPACAGIRDPIVQTMASEPGRDLRVYVLDGRILASVMRSNDRDFRANYKLGGSIELCDPPAGVAEMVAKFCDALSPDLAGIDFVFDGRPVFNEMEDAVGTRMLYELTDLDPANLLADLVHSKMSL